MINQIQIGKTDYVFTFGINIATYVPSCKEVVLTSAVHYKSLTGGKNMTLKKLNRNQKGFTLIELMIVIAIIGILAAIAIPNFIAYRNKSFCSATESDAQSIASAIADYFAIPTNVSITDGSLEEAGVSATLSNNNTWNIDATDPNNIFIVVTDASQRCPLEYQNSMLVAQNPRGYWNGVDQGGIYTKNMSME